VVAAIVPNVAEICGDSLRQTKSEVHFPW